MILLAVLLPPLYFLLNKKIGMFLITSAMLVVAMFLAMTVVLLPVSLILWVIAIIAAVRHNRRKELVAHAEMLATKMAEKMR
jgi:uncharacterized membrane protein